MTQHRRAFSLLELSVVLVIISVVTTFGINLGTTALKGSERITTQERLKIIQKALDAYVAMNGYLPCPANRALTPTGASFGLETRSGTSCTMSSPGVRSVTVGNTIYIGAVPNRALGLPDSYAGDAWDNKFLYAVGSAHVGSSAAYATTAAPISILSGDSGATISTDSSEAAGAGAVYVVLSHGPDQSGAYPLLGTSTFIACTSAPDSENCDENDLIFTDAEYNDGAQATTFFDDFIVWGSNMRDFISTTSPTAVVGTGAGCSSGCEPWCAVCKNSPTYTTRYICQRAIISNSPCQARCVYAYPSNSTFCP